jgi:hypothetical protein
MEDGRWRVAGKAESGNLKKVENSSCGFQDGIYIRTS